jgi:hypothetical protein
MHIYRWPWRKRLRGLITGTMRLPSPSLLHGRHLDRTVIILRVGCYTTYKLSYPDLVESWPGAA